MNTNRKPNIINGIKSEIVVSDIHHPYSAKGAWNIALKIIKDTKPDLISVLGDGADVHALNRHPKDAIDKTLFKWEVEENRNEWSKLRKSGKKSAIKYFEGNHETNLSRYLRDRAPELQGLVELEFPTLLHLDKLKFDWISEHEKTRIGKLWHHHGHSIPGGGKFPAKNKFNNTWQNLIFGHHHTFDYYSVRLYGSNELIQVAANASLYTLQADYTHHTNWDIGVTQVNYIERTGDFEIRPIPFRETPDFEGGYFAIYNGREYFSHPGEDIDSILARNAKTYAMPRKTKKAAVKSNKNKK